MRTPWYYRFVIGLARPLYRIFLALKKTKLPHYRREINERFGHSYVFVSRDKPIVWCHAVSLGELNTAYPLLRLLLSEGYHLWITSTTQTGFARAKILFQEEMGQSVQHSFVPVDDEVVVGRFLAYVRPVIAMFVETELWANTLSLLAKKNIPSVMVNARLTQRSFEGYAKFAKLSQGMMANLTAIIAQDSQSYRNFIELGASADKVTQAYSLKWCSQGEVVIPKIDTPDRPIWVMASTHEGEEVLALDVHKKLLVDFPDLLLILVPRHPERFDEVASLCADFIYHRRSQNEPMNEVVQVYLADSMGELMTWYAMCDVAVVGGSFVNKGGHNPIEPISLGKPVVMGRYVKNCTEIVRDFDEIGALIQTDNDGLYQALKTWLDAPDRAKQAGENGQKLVSERAGADKVQFEILKGLLS